MPSLSMYLAIAKKYLEQHPEENEEEFIAGIIEPDRRRNLKVERGRLHYGETSHRPDLNRFCEEQGLGSSYSRGYFLNLLTDYLFYNKFLQEYSLDIFQDFKRMNKKIEGKYNVTVPEELKGRVKYKEGDLRVINEEAVYSFIDSVGQLDLEAYKHIDGKETGHKVKFVGLKAGLLYKHNESNYFNSHDEQYFYGFENNYGVLIRRIVGVAETEGAKEGLYQVTPYGLAVKPSKILKLEATDIERVSEILPDEVSDEILSQCEGLIGREINRDTGYNFRRMNKEEIKVILDLIRRLPERTPQKQVTDGELNSDYIQQDDIEIS